MTMKESDHHRYVFRFRQEFQSFIDTYKNDLIGKSINGYFNYGGHYTLTNDGPVVLWIGSKCIILNYFFLSDVVIDVVPYNDLENDPKISFIYFGELDESSYRYEMVLDETFPLYNVPIKDITLDGFTEKFEVNAATGDTRPAGGDYFSTIRLIMADNRKLCLCAEDAESDGYIDTWIEGADGKKILYV